MYGSYVNDNNISSSSCDINISNSIEASQSLYTNDNGRSKCYIDNTVHKNNEKGLSNSVAPDPIQEFENYGKLKYYINFNKTIFSVNR